MKTITAIRDMQRTTDALRRDGRRIAFVPTMGYLHEGHLQLIRRARAEADFTAVSIFVNPSQFGPKEDFSRYPRDLARDSALAEQAGCDLLFVPETDEMYPPGFSTRVSIAGLASVLEGASRPGHFDGVATVVAKLLNIVRPHVAVFGQKDAQQVAVIRAMLQELNFDTALIVEPTVREADGLAMSSRNVYLSPEERQRALALSRALESASALYAGGERRASALAGAVRSELASTPGVDVDYVAVMDAETFTDPEADCMRPLLVAIAAKVGSTRLIDNTLLQEIPRP
ncbi:MAG: pantoate--beta-alanine ligase [Ignavibacteriae bacterium]|nr:pantoate--beta-alanine ligase [Ignavibacteriota bacterium]